MNDLLDLICAVFPVSRAFQEELVRRLKPVSLPKHTLLLTPGQVSVKMYYVEKGLVRGYYLKEHKEFTTGFMRETNFVISPVSFYGQQPSFEYLELLEDSILWELSRQNIEHLHQEYIEFNFVGRLITEQYYTRSELRAHQLRTKTAEERYQAFLNDYADLLNRVSNKHIASFLSLTPETISRIRAKKA